MAAVYSLGGVPMTLTIDFEDCSIDITVIYADEDEIDWEVFDTETDHNKLLNKLLHEHLDDDMQSLIYEAMEEAEKEAELERQLSDMDE